MRRLKDEIMENGVVLSDTILKVDSFINHQVDVALMRCVADEIVYRFRGEDITKVVTVESSGIPPAFMVANCLNVPLLFAKKKAPSTQTDDVYSAKAWSFTKKVESNLTITKKYLDKFDKVLIVDDFLATGEATNALISIVNMSGARLVGVAAVIEKCFQDGGKKLRASGIRVESLARVKSLKNGVVLFEV